MNQTEFLVEMRGFLGEQAFEQIAAKHLPAPSYQTTASGKRVRVLQAPTSAQTAAFHAALEEEACKRLDALPKPPAPARPAAQITPTIATPAGRKEQVAALAPLAPTTPQKPASQVTPKPAHAPSESAPGDLFDRAAQDYAKRRLRSHGYTVT